MRFRGEPGRAGTAAKLRTNFLSTSVLIHQTLQKNIDTSFYQNLTDTSGIRIRFNQSHVSCLVELKSSPGCG